MKSIPVTRVIVCWAEEGILVFCWGVLFHLILLFYFICFCLWFFVVIFVCCSFDLGMCFFAHKSISSCHCCCFISYLC